MSAGVIAAIVLVPLAVSPLGLNQFGPTKLLAATLAAALIGLGFALEPEVLGDGVLGALDSRLGWAFAGYLGIATLSLVTSVAPLQSALGGYPEYQGFAMLILWATIALGAMLLALRETGWERIARAIVVAMLAVAAVACLQKAGVATIGEAGGGARRVWSTIGNASHLGVWLVLALPFSAERFFSDALRAWRIAAAASGVMGVAALIWSGSRGAWIGILLSLVVGAVLMSRGGTRVQQVRIALASVAVGTLATTAMLLTAGRFLRIGELLDISRGSAAWRMVVWKTALRMTADRPVLGWGLNSVRSVYPSYRSASALDSPINMGTVADMHNLVLNTAVSLGIAGVVALLGCIALVAVTVWRTASPPDRDRMQAATAGASLTGFLGAMLFHYPAIDSGTLASVVVGALMALGVRQSAVRAGTRAGARIPQGPIARVTWRTGAYALSAALIVAALATGSLVVADQVAAQALASAASGAPWPSTRTALRRAVNLAPWEVAYLRIWASAGTASIARHADPAVVADANTALDEAMRMAPLDSGIAGARADLLLAVARGSRSDADLDAAEQAYRDAMKRDPNNAVYLAGIATVQYARGDFDQAVSTLERVVILASDSPLMWKALAQAYQAAGRPQDARTAEIRALRAGNQ